MSEKQCGTCKWWDKNNIRSIETNYCDMHIADCMSQDSSAESFVDTGGSDGELEKYPMIVDEGKDCPAYKEITECPPTP